MPAQLPHASPDEANTVWPWAAASMKALSFASIDPSIEAANSHSPKEALAAFATF